MDSTIEGLVAAFEAGAISRRDLLKAILLLVAGGSDLAAAPSRSQIPVSGLNHVSIFVSDLDRSVAFYRELFGLPILSSQPGGVNLALGPSGQFLGIYQVPGSAPRIDHLCLGVDGFEAQGVQRVLAERGVESRVRMRGEVPELYFPDPDGLSIQIQDTAYCGGSGVRGDQC